MLTDKGQELFAQLVDLNYEVSNMRLQLLEKSDELEKVRGLLIEEIGQENYSKFMYMGQKVFASVND